MTDICNLHNVHLSYPTISGDVHVLRGVSMSVRQGEAMGIVGPSGSGKTSLLMVIAGLEIPQSGSVTVAGVPLVGRKESELARFRRDTIGIIFQSFHLIPTLTAQENVAIPLEFRGDADAAERSRDALASVGLGHRLNHYPSQLSGGEQQRVAIARAVATGARLILADEPTGNLDQETGRAIMQLLFDLQAKQGTTLLLITHDPGLAERCDRILHVRDGIVT